MGEVIRNSADRGVVVREQGSGGRSVWGFAVTIVNVIFGIIELLLLLRFVLKLLGASATAPFIAWIYQVTQPLIAPFAGAFGASVSQGSVVEWVTLLAMVVFAAVAWIIGFAISSLAARTTREI